MRKCNKCSQKIEKRGKKLFCLMCKSYKLPFETYKFHSILNHTSKSI